MRTVKTPAVFKKWLDRFKGLGLWGVGGIVVLAWVVIAWLVSRVELGAQGSNITGFGDSLWWGAVTFLTVGYGDRYPVTTEGRVFAGALMLIGVSGIGILTAKISSYFLEKTLREGRGAVDTSSLKDHFVVCGWKEEMHEILAHILDFNPGLEADQIVLIANIEQTAIDQIRAHPRLKKVHVISSDYYTEMSLRRAAPERAKKVMILADRTLKPGGVLPTMTEVDARTIMAAMTLSSFARGTEITAEILDARMDQYLKLANVSEIIYSREYSRLLLGNASGGTGITNIIFELLDPKTAAVISTEPLPDHFVEKSYAELRHLFATEKRNRILIGVLENSGNSHKMKELAIKRAQKTADVNELVQNLKHVKELRCNRPVFNPPDDYLVHEGSMAIVIATGAAA